MFRRLHRWSSLPLIAFLVLVLATGAYLQIDEVVGLFAEEPDQSRVVASAEALTHEQITAQLATALAKAHDAEPDFAPRRIELTIEPGKQATRLSMRARGGPFVEIDHATGQVRAEMNPEMPLHVIFIRLHTGAALGAAGILIMFACSLIPLFLAVSGGVLYWQMWRNRAARGRGSVFWQ